VPAESRAARSGSLTPSMFSQESLQSIRGLADIARDRDQSLPQMAVAWALRDPRVTSALIGASSVSQLEETVAALGRLEFTTDELAEIDRYATEGDINLWKPPKTDA
jgi:L-glyceraldehyde 3-phosphate reductase